MICLRYTKAPPCFPWCPYDPVPMLPHGAHTLKAPMAAINYKFLIQGKDEKRRFTWNGIPPLHSPPDPHIKQGPPTL